MGKPVWHHAEHITVADRSVNLEIEYDHAHLFASLLEATGHSEQLKCKADVSETQANHMDFPLSMRSQYSHLTNN